MSPGYLDGNFESLNVIPKFTKGVPYHPYHPKRYIHDQIDAMIEQKRRTPDRLI